MPESGKKSPVLRQVWEDNYIEEQKLICQVVPRHNYVTVQCRVIGTAARKPLCLSSSPAAAILSTPDERYAHFRQHENTMRLLQLGMTFSDEAGNLPKDPESDNTCIWQFNVRVINPRDVVNGIDDFQRHLTENGVDVQINKRWAIIPEVFSVGLWCMDTIMRDRIRWVVFCGTSTFGPLLKALSLELLPERRKEFLQLVGLYFPKFYEVTQLMAPFGLSGTLEDVARVLGLEVEGQPSNDAGAGSLLTLQAFLELRKKHFREGIPEDKANLILSIC